jgi:hypothetical protein
VSQAPIQPPRGGGSKVWLWILLIGGGLFVVCGGACGISIWYAYSTVAGARANGDKLWADGKKDEAVIQYTFALAMPTEKDKPSIVKKVVEYEVQKGDEKTAKDFIKVALQAEVRDMKFDDAKAQKLWDDTKKEVDSGKK